MRRKHRPHLDNGTDNSGERFSTAVGIHGLGVVIAVNCFRFIFANTIGAVKNSLKNRALSGAVGSDDRIKSVFEADGFKVRSSAAVSKAQNDASNHEASPIMGTVFS